jgi:electron transfer flavoprotein alpha subunit
MTNEKRIFVIGEIDPQKGFTSLTEELIGGARNLADGLGGSVDLMVVTSGNESLPWEKICRGSDRVYVVANPDVTIFDTETITGIAALLCGKIHPILCLLGQTELGRDVAPRLAARIDAGLCMDCTDVKYESAQDCFVQTRPVYGGKAMAVFGSTPGRPQVNTIRPKSLPPLASEDKHAGEKTIVSDEVKIQDKVRLLHCEKSREEGIRLEEAKVIVAGGGGLGGARGFEIIGELARVLNAAVGATRVPVDEKWVEHHMEIGQTGKIVSPDLYIAIGISGATQHITGILGSGKIIAINKDPDANIFRVADYGLVADYKEAIPVLIDKLKGKAA